ncbi:MAG: hypothetical protein KDA66_07780 [Planctomycetaceae bacterium]|nr:hypothetical protein [Planctomycetaceae bacterium]
MRRLAGWLLLTMVAALVLVVLGIWNTTLLASGGVMLAGATIGQYLLWRQMNLDALERIMTAYVQRHAGD